MDTVPFDLQELAIAYYSTQDLSFQLLKGDGSDRQIYRIMPLKGSGPVVIGVYHENLVENHDFILIAGKMAEAGISAPEVYTTAPSGKAYLQEYLGEETLADAIQRWSANSQRDDLLSAYRQVLSELVRIQRLLPPLLSEFLNKRQMTRSDFIADLNYFKRDFLQRYGYEALYTSAVEEELFDNLLVRLDSSATPVFVYRDFQSRNFMWKEGQPWFIDFQSAFLGAPYYDLASCLYSSRSGLSQQEREALLHHYFQESACDPDVEQFLYRFYPFVLIRRLRSLGSYGFLSGNKNKPGFYEAIPPTLIELIGLLKDHPQLRDYANLREMITEIAGKWQEKPKL